MITVKAGTTVAFLLTTHSDTGANVNADSTPTFTIRSSSYSSVDGPTNFTNATTGVYYGTYATSSSTANSTTLYVVASVTISGVTQTVLVETIYVLPYDVNDTTRLPHYGTAQAGASSSVTLASTASATNDTYNRSLVTIVSGTGVGQTRIISAYNGTTKVATVETAWTTTPDTTSVYVVAPAYSPAVSSIGPVLAYTAAGAAIMPAAGNVGTNGVLLGDEEDIYPAYLDFTVDGANSQDEYTVTWYKNGTLQTSGITSPTITVTKRSDGTALVATTSMTEIGSTGSYKYDEGTYRLGDGESALVTMVATIDGSPRTWRKLISRDST